MASTTGLIDTNIVGATAVELALTTETVITLYTKLATGSHNNSRVTLEFSPDGVVWLQSYQSTNGNGIVTFNVSAAKARVAVSSAEGSPATANVFIVAK
jgi:hypothetical protein